MIKFVVLYSVCGLINIQCRPFTSRDHARAFCRSLSDREDIDAYSMHRVGEKLGSFVRHGAHEINQVQRG